MKYIDLKFLNDITRGNEAQIKSFISTYLKESDELMKNFKSSFSLKETEQLISIAHSLKSSAKIIGVKKLNLLLEDFHQNLLQNNWNEAESIYPQILSTFEISESELEDYIK